MVTIIGVDPHKSTHTAVAICGDEHEVAKVTVRATCHQVSKLLSWAEPFNKRRWAIESAGGLGYLLAQQLVEAGECVLDVPPTLAARVRVLSSGRSDKRTIPTMRFRSPSRRYAQEGFGRSSSPITPRFCVSWLSETTTWGGSEPRWSADFTPPWPTSHRVELPRNSTLLTPKSCSKPSNRSLRLSTCVATWPLSCSMTFVVLTRRSRRHTGVSARPSRHRRHR